MKHFKHFALTVLVALVSSFSASAENYILYTSLYGNVVTPCHSDVFGANIVSNTYEEGQGKILFDGEVTSIGYSAFYGRSGLTSINIPNSVTEIGDCAFYNCSGLTAINIPNSVTEISNSAFGGCSGLTAINIPNSVIEIGAGAFADCRGLTAINIPNSVIEIGAGAFYWCSGLTSVNITDLEAWCKINFVDSDSNPLSYAHNLYLNGELVTNLVIPNSVTKIGKYAFEHSHLTSVKISNSVTEIGDYAFKDCSNLTSVTLGAGLLSVGYHTFEDCPNLYKMILLSNTKPERLSLIGKINYVANDNYGSGTSIKKYDFLSSMFEVGGVIYVPVSPSERTCAAIDCTYNKDVKDITIGKTVNYRGVEMKVVEINPYVLANNKHVESINVSAETAIQSSFAKGCTGLQTLIIEKTVTDIGKEAFSWAMTTCTDGQITLNNSGIIYENSFKGCTGLQTLTVGETVTDIRKEAFYGAMKTCTDGQITLNNTGSVGDYAFENCSGLHTLVVGNTVGNLGDYAFAGSMTNVENGKIILNNQGCINSDCFNGCSKMESATLGETITEIGSSAFADCSSLRTINLPINLQAIYSETFKNCVSLTDIIIPDKVEKIQSNAFHNSGLLSIVIPSSVVEIGNGVFNGCISLAKFKAKDGKEPLDMGYNDKSKGLFYDCPLKEVVIGRNLFYNTGSSYGYSPFFRNISLEKVTLTDIPTEVFTNEFYGCTGLKEVSLGDRVKKINDYAFSGCSSLESFAFGASVKEIGAEAFSDCINMAKLYAEPTTPPICGSQALDDINKWNCTLYVNPNAKEDYSKADQWKEFFFMENYEYPEVKFEVESITLSNTSIDMLVGETATITATINPEDATDMTVAWSSSDENIVTVSNEGLIKAIAVGKVIVTAKCGEVTASCEVTVSAISKLTYTVDGEVVSSEDVEYGTTIVPIEEPTKEGYTFSGWSEIPETMPDHDVEVTGTFSINSYDLIYMLGDEEYQRQTYEFGSAIVPLGNPTVEGFIFHEWLNIPETMPAHDVTVYADMEVDGIESIFTDDEIFTIYNIQGTLIMKGATMDAVKLLPNGVYVINGKLVRLYRR